MLLPSIYIPDVRGRGQSAVAESAAFDANAYGTVLLWASAASASTLWQDTGATSQATADGHSVARIDNLSTSYTSAQVRFQQGTAGREGILKLGVAPNGGNAIRFDGVNDNLPVVNNVGGTHATLTVLNVYNSTVGGYPMVAGGDSGGSAGSGSFSEMRAGGAAGDNKVDVSHHLGDDRRATLTGAAAHNVWQVHGIIESAFAHNARFFNKGTEATSYANTGTNRALAIVVGAASPSGYNGGLAGFSNLAAFTGMDWLESVIWTTALSATDLQAASTALMSKWGIT